MKKTAGWNPQSLAHFIHPVSQEAIFLRLAGFLTRLRNLPAHSIFFLKKNVT